MNSSEPLLNRRRAASLTTSIAILAGVVAFGAAVARNDDGSRTFFNDEATAAQSRFSLQQSERRVATAIGDQVRSMTGTSKSRLAAGERKRTLTVSRLVRPVKERVTIFTDATLKRGDAVMTDSGIRIFNGAQTFPHRQTDFVAVKRVDGLSRAVTRTLLAMDAVPPA